MSHQQRNERAIERKSILKFFKVYLLAYKQEPKKIAGYSIVCYVVDQEMLLTEELTWLDVPAEKKFLSYLISEAKKVLGTDYQIYLDECKESTVPY